MPGWVLRAGVAAMVLAGLSGHGAWAAAGDNMAVAVTAPVTFTSRALDGTATGLRGTDEGASGLVAYLFAGGRDWPAIRFRAEPPLDWSRAAALALPVDNPSAEPFDLLLRLDDRADANGDDRSLSGAITVPPRTRWVVLLPLGIATSPGMRGQPPSGLVAGAGERVITAVTGSVAPGHVVALHVSGVHTAGDRTLLIGQPVLRPRIGTPPRPEPIADRFGQAIAGAPWPEKVADEPMLRRKLDAAAAQTRRLAAGPNRAVTARDGGVGHPLAGQATGFFHTAEIGGRWALVTPAGRAFLSLGVDAVLPTNPTVVAGRAGLFADLPGPTSPLATFYGDTAGRRTFDIGGANLQRGLGPDWRTLWPAQTIARLRAWGFNTLGNWSDPGLGRALPHVVFWDVEGRSATVPMGWRTLPDPFDPGFAAVADTVAAAMTADNRDDPLLIGYFSGNELPWGEARNPADGVTPHVLALGPDSPARQALRADLQARYGTPAAAARAWGLPGAATWDAALAWPAIPTAATLADAARFEGLFAARYFATVAAAIKRHDPHHLYLGTRFAAATPAVVGACARFCDVLSFNVYGTTPAGSAPLWDGLDRPVLIGEFHVGSLDRGSYWPGLHSVPTEADRGPAYATYLRAAVTDRHVVGAHWYQYADEPLTGRPYDGENGHIGLVAVTDVPFGGFVEAVAAANAEAQTIFARSLATRPAR